MIYKLSLLALVLSLFGCEKNQIYAIDNGQQSEAQQPVEDQESPIIEYLWQLTGPDFTEQRLTEITATLNKLIDAEGYEIITANILRPQFETDNFDLIWVLLWSSEAARDRALAHWNKHQARNWRQEVAGVLNAEPSASFLYDLLWGYKSSELNLVAGDTFFSTFNFCTMAETQGHKELQGFKSQYNEWLSQGLNATEYGYLTLKARFDLEGVDFVWLDIFGDTAARQAKTKNWPGSKAQQLWDNMTSCENFEFSSTKIRS
ncbi:MAG: hypothetical protein P8O91_05605 [Luminiphilus sp.]|nr:hypothetical protein [Luminiphilus sp.]